MGRIFVHQLPKMKEFPLHLIQRLEKRKAENAFRELPEALQGVDFCSNDYLGLSRNSELLEDTLLRLSQHELLRSGASGSRLISGNHPLYHQAESFLAEVLKDEMALIFNSGYDANTGLISSIAGKSDVILYDEWVHASIREGIRLSQAKAYKFAHNEVGSLKKRLEKCQLPSNGVVYVITEGVFSMDGDTPDLVKMTELCEKFGARLIVDEAHALGVSKPSGLGESVDQGIHESVFARVFTFGKAAGTQGAAVVGSPLLKDFLVNFSRPLIYTTALPPIAVSGILSGVGHALDEDLRGTLQQRISFFRRLIRDRGLTERFLPSETPIQSLMMPGNSKARLMAKKLQQAGFLVKAILSPTVPQGMERLRICLHTYNSEEEISNLMNTFQTELTKL